MIKGIHAMFYSPKAAELRAFIRDKLGLRFTDVGDEWLIFDPDEAEVGCHPSDRTYHEISFYCEDLEGTVAALKERGVEFVSEVTDAGFGSMISFRLPDGTEAGLYEPKYQKGDRRP